MRLFLVAVLTIWAGMAAAEPPQKSCSTGKWGQVHCIRDAHFVFDTCNAIATFADRHGLNRDFFARLIWQESRFDPHALSHANARGIAQFIPQTAALRGLADPYNPADALEHSAEYLAEMVRRYGNEGLAAVGYNGGERRVEGFIEGGGLAPETIAYVPIITGLPAEVWRDTPPEDHDFALSKTEPFEAACASMAQKRRLTPLTPPEPKLKPWGVQVGFGTSKSAARDKVGRQTAACRATAQQERLDLVYRKNRVSGRSGFYFAQFGRDSRKGAQSLCDSLRRQGCVCLVIKN